MAFYMQKAPCGSGASKANRHFRPAHHQGSSSALVALQPEPAPPAASSSSTIPLREARGSSRASDAAWAVLDWAACHHWLGGSRSPAAHNAQLKAHNTWCLLAAIAFQPCSGATASQAGPTASGGFPKIAALVLYERVRQVAHKVCNT
jgi:hypothetical protein